MQNNQSNEMNLDILFLDIARFVVESQNASIPAIQREFGIPYARAGRVVDQLEIVGIIHGDPRVVLIKNQSDLKFHLEFQGLSIGVQSTKEEASKPDLNTEMTGTTPTLILQRSYIANLADNNPNVFTGLLSILTIIVSMSLWFTFHNVIGTEFTDSFNMLTIGMFMLLLALSFVLFRNLLDKDQSPIYIYWSGSTFEAVLKDNSVNKYFDCTNVKIDGNKAKHQRWLFPMKVQHPLLCAKFEELKMIHALKKV